jgi:hypothetical protein
MVVKSVSAGPFLREPVIPGAAIGRNRHAAPGRTPVHELRRCLTCKLELSPELEHYCSDACRLKHGVSKRTPGRTAARRRRRRGGKRR